MEVLSCGWRTDLAILTLSGSEVGQHPTYVVVRTPDNPGYHAIRIYRSVGFVDSEVQLTAELA